MSAWVSGPDRGLHPVQKDEGTPVPPDATFQPELMSSPDIRNKAKSSAYGTVVPKTEKVVLEKNDLRPWEEQPTFKPELPDSDLRSKARSSSYGVAVPTKDAPTAPSPSFKPELVTQTSKLSLQWSEKARSSKYGVQAAAASPTAPAPAPSFTPEIKTTTFREKYQSSVCFPT